MLLLLGVPMKDHPGWLQHIQCAAAALERGMVKSSVKTKEKSRA